MTPSTYFGLLAEFGAAHIPVTEIGAKYFGYDEERSKREAAKGVKGAFNFPVFKVGSAKTVWMVDAAVFGEYLDKIKAKAKEEYRAAK